MTRFSESTHRDPYDLAHRKGIRIVAAAVIQDGKIWSLPAPARHHNIFSHARECGYALISSGHQQGFLASDGRFLSRQDAFMIANRCGQILKGPRVVKGCLFSENVW